MSVKILLIVLISSLFIGCSQRVQEVEISTVPTEKTALNLSEPAQLKLKPVKWFIITPENSKEIWDKMKKENLDLVIFGLSDNGYQNLSINMAEIRKYLLEQKDIINSYKEYYEKD